MTSIGTSRDGPDSLAWACEPLEQRAAQLGYTVTYRALAKGHGGSCGPAAKLLTINSGQAVNAQIDVLCHELAHVLVRVDRRATGAGATA